MTTTLSLTSLITNNRITSTFTVETESKKIEDNILILNSTTKIDVIGNLNDFINVMNNAKI